MKDFHLLFALLTGKERKQAFYLLCLTLVMALTDMIGVASIMPFITVLASPEVVQTNIFLRKLSELAYGLGIDSQRDFLILLGVIVFLVLLTSLGLKAVTTFFQTRFILTREYSIGKRLLEGYLRQPYSWFLDKNSANLGKTILSEVGQVVNQGLVPAINLFSQTAVTLAIVVLLVAVDPYLALTVSPILAVVYYVIFRLVKNFLSLIGVKRLQANEERFLIANEAFQSIKVCKASSLEARYVNRFASPAKSYAQFQASAQMIAHLPRFVLEAIAFGGLLAVTIFQMAKNNDNFSTVLPTIALYAFAGYRLMPALQQIYAAITQLRFIRPSLIALHKDLSKLAFQNEGVLYPLEPQKKPFPLLIKNIIEIKNICYSYPNTSTLALKGVSFRIPINSTVGLVGKTGSGKTTLVDVILGLLGAESGSIEVDGIPLNNKTVRNWQASVGYVPQQTYLADTSIVENIAFGLEPDEIDFDAVNEASKIANIHDFIVTELESGYGTVVGEQGVRLSGGQRQRIGIARALYHKPKVLILDEATSALDGLTERALMEAVDKISGDLTKIIVAHRLETIKHCDHVVLMEDGRILEQGVFEKVMRNKAILSAQVWNQKITRNNDA